MTLRSELHKSAWCELHVAFFMLANWIILTGFEVKENILINQPISCISSFLRQRTNIGNAERRPSQTGSELAWWVQILTLWETSGFDMSICPFGLRLANTMRADLPNWACFGFIIYKLGICHLWSAIRAHAEEVGFLSPPFHYSTLTHFGVRRWVKFNRGIILIVCFVLFFLVVPHLPTGLDTFNSTNNLLPSYLIHGSHRLRASPSACFTIVPGMATTSPTPCFHIIATTLVHGTASFPTSTPLAWFKDKLAPYK